MWRATGPASRWLRENELLDAEADSCLVRRTIGADGRSKAYINDSPVTTASLRQLGDLLVDIVSQREHQSLLRRPVQLALLDDYCVERPRLEEMRSLYRQWQANRSAAARLRGAEDDGRAQLLAYQIEELRELAVEDGEAESLAREHRRLSGAEQTLAALAAALGEVAENEQSNALDHVRRALQALGELSSEGGRVANAAELLAAARIQLDEAGADLRAAAEEFPIDAERLAQVDERLGKLHDMARKHRVKAAELPQLTQSLEARLQEFRGREQELQRLDGEESELRGRYAQVAGEVGAQRRAGAQRLAREIEQHIAQLGMGQAAVEIRFEDLPRDTIHADGLEKVEFLIRSNPGQAPGPLSKIASGGELSRVSLAIRLATARTSQMPCLVFDEIDVGIGGGVAAQVGALLRALGDSAQILCVTHQPQVASRAHRQYSVSKHSEEGGARTSIVALDAEARVREVARMLAGEEFGDAPLAHAEEMLAVDR